MLRMIFFGLHDAPVTLGLRACESRCHGKVTRRGHLGVLMSAHSIELLHSTDPPGPRALRLVLLLVLAAILTAAAVWAMDRAGAPPVPDAARTESDERSP